MEFTENAAYNAPTLATIGENNLLAESGRFITVWESNYNLTRKLPVVGTLSVGQLTLRFVEEIGRNPIILDVSLVFV